MKTLHFVSVSGLYKKINYYFIKEIFFFRRVFLICLLSFVYPNTSAAQITLVEWNFPNNPDDLLADSGISINSTRAISLSGNRSVTYYTGATSFAASAYGWENGMNVKFWQITLNSAGYTTLTLSSRQRSSATGPAHFKIIYSTDQGQTWSDAATTVITTGDDWSSGLLNITLPPPCNNQPELIIRWVMASNTSVDGGTVTAGTSRIDDIVITGCNIFIDSFQPVNGPAGTSVTLNGSNFQNVTSVSFNGINASFFIVNGNTITARVPVMFSSGPVSITNGSCTSTSVTPFQLLNTCPDNRSNLLISELCDPYRDYQTTRYIEIYNPTEKDISLSGWKVVAIRDGTGCTNWELSGIIKPGEALTCGTTNPLYGGPHSFTTPEWNWGNGCYLGWNGERRDGAILYNGQTVIDYVFYESTNRSWFMDRSLIRNSDICIPSPVMNISEWNVYPVEYAGTAPSTPRSHLCHCIPPPIPVITIQPADQDQCEHGNANFRVVATGITPLAFQWKYFNELTGSWEDITGNEYTVTNDATSSTLTFTDLPATYNQRQFYCEVRNYGGECFQLSNAVEIRIADKEPPTFSSPPDLNVCAENIKTAVYNTSAADLVPDLPDFFLFSPGNTTLDLDSQSFKDNCPSACVYEIRWKITMQDGSTLPPVPGSYLTGQPSNYASDIHFLSDASSQTPVSHTITYWLVDCSGNVSEPLNRAIIVNPRPDLIKN